MADDTMITVTPARSVPAASRSALSALIQRDLRVLFKNFGEFAGRTLMQPLLLVFVFLYVFPTIGQGVGSGGGRTGSRTSRPYWCPGWSR